MARSAVIYLVDTTEVPDFNTMYELYDPCTCMFFFRNKHIMVRLKSPLGASSSPVVAAVRSPLRRRTPRQYEWAHQPHPHRVG